MPSFKLTLNYRTGIFTMKSQNKDKILPSGRIKTPPNVQRKWERDAAEMRARIEQGKPAIEEKK